MSISPTNNPNTPLDAQHEREQKSAPGGIGFYSVDFTIDKEGRPQLIELNGSKSGFLGFEYAHGGDKPIMDAIGAAFDEFAPGKEIHVATRLARRGEMPPGYLDKLVHDLLCFRGRLETGKGPREGNAGLRWARNLHEGLPGTARSVAEGSRMLFRDKRFVETAIDAARPGRAVPLAHYEIDDESRELIPENSASPQTVRLGPDSILWIRCPSLEYAETPAAGTIINPEYPHRAISDNKLFTCDILSPELSAHIPQYIPAGCRCSDSHSIRALLDSSTRKDLFIFKPLLASNAKGIELLSRSGLQAMAARLARREKLDAKSGALPFDMRGAALMLAAGAFRHDAGMICKLAPSKPVRCRRTNELHHGCVRAVAMLKTNGPSADIRFLGAYWRLASSPIDGDALPREVYIASMSQGGFSEPLSAEDSAAAGQFVHSVLSAFISKTSALPADKPGYAARENGYWLARLRSQLPFRDNDSLWGEFLEEIQKSRALVQDVKRRAEEKAYRKWPELFLPPEIIKKSKLPFRITE